MMDCKKALEACGGDFDKAVEYLRKKGIEVANKRSGRQASQGMVSSYIHLGGKVGVLVEVNCESDFVAKSEHFTTFVKDVAMHIAAASPDWVSREDVPQAVLDKEKEILKEQALKSGKPREGDREDHRGRLTSSTPSTACPISPFVKDTDKTIKQLLTSWWPRPARNAW